MKKRVLTFFLLFFVVLSFLSYAVTDCKIVAKKLHDLQNEIMEKSFRKLPAGSWAQHGKNRLVYLGEKISPKTGLKLRVVEFQGIPEGQLWFKLSPKDVEYEGKTYRFWTVEPMEAYAVMGQSVYYIPKSAIELFMRGKNWSIALFEGTISPVECTNRTALTEKILTFPGGKKVNATIIESLENHAKVICSPDVPFGMINTITSQGVPSKLGLTDFGFSGGKSKISGKMLKSAKPFPFFGGSFGK